MVIVLLHSTPQVPDASLFVLSPYLSLSLSLSASARACKHPQPSPLKSNAFRLNTVKTGYPGIGIHKLFHSLKILAGYLSKNT